jgi:hypothetical protein
LNELKNTIMSSLTDLQAAAKEIGGANPNDIRTKCMAKKHTTPVDCLKECGMAVKETPEGKKAWEAAMKQKKKPAAKAK